MAKQNLWTSIYESLFPRHCLSCNKEGAWLCSDCSKKIVYLKTYFCPFCRRITPQGQLCPSCRRRYSLTGILSACYFQPPVSDLIHRLKYQKTKELGRLLAKIMIKGTANRLPRGQKLIVPIPLHRRQLRKRGFNQSELLAKELAQELEIEYNSGILKRIKNTKSQTKLNRSERKENVKDAFSLTGKIELENRTILLVDDVTTTGATLNEAAKILRKTKAREIWGWVVCKS